MSADANTTSFRVYYVTKGTALYKNQEDKPFASIADNEELVGINFNGVSLKEGDYMRAQHSTKTSVKIRLENNNKFDIDVKIANQKNFTFPLEDKHNVTLTINKSDKIFVTKTKKQGVIPNESGKNPEKSPPTNTESNTKISFLVYGYSRTKLYKNGKKDPEFSFDTSGNADNDRTTVSLRADDYISFKKDSKDEVTKDPTDILIRIRNENDFDIHVTTENEASIIKPLGILVKTVKKSEKIFVTKKKKDVKIKPNEPDKNPGKLSPTNTDTKSNTEISFLVYADKGTKLYKNGGEDPYFSFESKNKPARVSLRSNDYMNVTTTTKKIEVENTNDFNIVIHEIAADDGRAYIRIKARKKETIYVLKAVKYSVFKAEINTNETDIIQMDDDGGLNEEGKIYLRIYADAGSELDFMFEIFEIDGKPTYGVLRSHHFQKFYGDVVGYAPTHVDIFGTLHPPSPNKFNPEPGSWRVSFRSIYDYLIINSGGNVKIKNLNAYPITVKIETNSEVESFHLGSQKKTEKALNLTNKVSKVFVTKKQGIKTNKPDKNPEKSPPTITNTESNTEISFFVYADKGTKLWKNGEVYFDFIDTKVQNDKVTVSLKADEYLNTSEPIKLYNINNFPITVKNTTLLGSKIFVQLIEFSALEKKSLPFDKVQNWSYYVIKGIGIKKKAKEFIWPDDLDKPDKNPQKLPPTNTDTKSNTEISA